VLQLAALLHFQGVPSSNLIPHSFRIIVHQHYITSAVDPPPSFLGSTAQLRPWPPPQNPAEFLGGFSTIFFFTG
jgi:hypothetical protein